MNGTIKLLLIVVAMFIGFIQANAQCECAGLDRKDGYGSFYIDAYDELNHSDAVFTGEVIEVKKHSETSELKRFLEVTYRVDQSWKGVETKTITILKEAATKGEKKLIYANYYKSKLMEGGCCSRTKMLSKAKADLELFKRKKLKPIKLK